MNVESLKTELQQVLDSDVALRKEFNNLKRSLSDYRNQLIMRDEDCKRLQVTIDVLNTKLVVMERDNSNYKAELNSFKELRGTIKEQLDAKQTEIDARIAEIQSLREELSAMAAGYEEQISQLKSDSSQELERVKEEFTAQIQELKTTTHYKESGIKEEFENHISELSIRWAEKEHSLLLNHEETIAKLVQEHAEELSRLKETAASSLTNETAVLQQQLEDLKMEHVASLSSLEQTHRQEVEHLRSALEEQRSTLTNNFNAQLETIRTESSVNETELTASYEKQLADLKLEHETALGNINAANEAKISALIAEYEEKLSNTLIHSTSQNSKLNEELSSVTERVELISDELGSRNIEIDRLNAQVTDLSTQLQAEIQKFDHLNTEYNAYKQNTSLSVSEQVNELNQQIVSLNQAHSSYVSELNTQMESLNLELKNMGLLFEQTTNQLSETEAALETKNQELQQAQGQIEELNSRIGSFENSFTDKEKELEDYRLELQNSIKDELSAKELEYQKLLAENTNLIEEIDAAQDKVEAQEAELSILRGELEEVKQQSAGKTDYFKETLANKNFEITNLEANNAALSQEVVQLKNEVAVLRDQLQNSSEASLQVASLQQQLETLRAEKLGLSAEIDVLQTVISGLNESVMAMNSKLDAYEVEIEQLKAQGKTSDSEEFIDRLFKQIDLLNDEKLALLDEKEQLANQLLKMNEVVGSISQQVDSERIDVTGLNNHRKNVILATNSGGNGEKSQMKEQINDLVREIDKCIALLSA